MKCGELRTAGDHMLHSLLMMVIGGDLNGRQALFVDTVDVEALSEDPVKRFHIPPTRCIVEGPDIRTIGTLNDHRTRKSGLGVRILSSVTITYRKVLPELVQV
jgi:hypothetical protein